MAELADALDSGSNRGNSVEVQVLLSAPRKTSTLCVLVFLFRCERGLEQHGTAAGGAAKAPVGLLLVRGSQRVGMSAKRTAVKIGNPNLFSIGEGFGFFVFFGKQNEGSFPTAVCPKPYQKKDRITKVTTVKVP